MRTVKELQKELAHVIRGLEVRKIKSFLDFVDSYNDMSALNAVPHIVMLDVIRKLNISAQRDRVLCKLYGTGRTLSQYNIKQLLTEIEYRYFLTLVGANRKIFSYTDREATMKNRGLNATAQLITRLRAQRNSRYAAVYRLNRKNIRKFLENK